MGVRKVLRGVRRRLRRLTMSEVERRHELVGPADLWEMKRSFQIKFLAERGLEPAHWLCDLGCGTLRGGIPLIEHLEDGHYVGLESREEVLAEARKELADAGLEHKSPVLVHSPDLRALALKQRFDVIWAFSVLIHMPDEVLDAALSFVAAHLTDGGVFYANLNLGDAEDADWQGFPVVYRPEAFYVEACARHGLVLRKEGSLLEVGHDSGSASQDAQTMVAIRRAGD